MWCCVSFHRRSVVSSSPWHSKHRQTTGRRNYRRSAAILIIATVDVGCGSLNATDQGLDPCFMIKAIHQNA